MQDNQPRKRRSPYRRQPRARFNLAPSHVRILKILFTYPYLTADLIALVYKHRHGRGTSHVPTELGSLWHQGYVERQPYHADHYGYGSNPLIYVLNHKGTREITDPETYRQVRTQIYSRKKPKAQRTLPHRCAISTLRLNLDLGLEDPIVSDFYGDQQVIIKVTLPGEKKLTTKRPDAVSVFEFKQDGNRFAYFWEIDRPVCQRS